MAEGVTRAEEGGQEGLQFVTKRGKGENWFDLKPSIVCFWRARDHKPLFDENEDEDEMLRSAIAMSLEVQMKSDLKKRDQGMREESEESWSQGPWFLQEKWIGIWAVAIVHFYQMCSIFSDSKY